MTKCTGKAALSKTKFKFKFSTRRFEVRGLRTWSGESEFVWASGNADSLERQTRMGTTGYAIMERCFLENLI
jgi:hypothetical protein